MRLKGVGVRNKAIFTGSKNVYFKKDITWNSYFIFLKEYTFEHDGIQHENLRVYVYNEEKFYEITVQSNDHFAYNLR